eukprot:3021393-Amphidinium_carterae.1
MPPTTTRTSKGTEFRPGNRLNNVLKWIHHQDVLKSLPLLVILPTPLNAHTESVYLNPPNPCPNKERQLPHKTPKAKTTNAIRTEKPKHYITSLQKNGVQETTYAIQSNFSTSARQHLRVITSTITISCHPDLPLLPQRTDLVMSADLTYKKLIIPPQCRLNRSWRLERRSCTNPEREATPVDEEHHTEFQYGNNRHQKSQDVLYSNSRHNSERVPNSPF